MPHVKRCQTGRDHRLSGPIATETGWVRRCQRRSCGVEVAITWDMAQAAVKHGRARIVLARRGSHRGQPVLVLGTGR